MKLMCDREQLLSAFQTAASVAPSRSPKPVLQNVKIEAGKESTMLLATDLEVGIRIKVLGLEVEAAGSALLPIAASTSRPKTLIRMPTSRSVAKSMVDSLPASILTFCSTGFGLREGATLAAV